MTSHDVVDRVRRRLPKGTKVGHLATLDPPASGVLPLAVGWATKLIPCLPEAEKAYLAEVLFGWRSDTLDAAGQMVQGSEPPADLQHRLLPLLQQYQGTVMQVPPRVSALRQDGQRSYDRARKGEDFELPARAAYYDEVRWVRGQPQRAVLRIRCGPGTYVRSLARDLGESLGCGAVLQFLLRLQSGFFCLDDARCLEELADPTQHLVPWDWPWRQQSPRPLDSWPPPNLEREFSGLARHPKGAALYRDGQKIWSREGIDGP